MERRGPYHPATSMASTTRIWLLWLPPSTSFSGSTVHTRRSSGKQPPLAPGNPPPGTALERTQTQTSILRTPRRPGHNFPQCSLQISTPENRTLENKSANLVFIPRSNPHSPSPPLRLPKLNPPADPPSTQVDLDQTESTNQPTVQQQKACSLSTLFLFRRLFNIHLWSFFEGAIGHSSRAPRLGYYSANMKTRSAARAAAASAAMTATPPPTPKHTLPQAAQPTQGTQSTQETQPAHAPRAARSGRAAAAPRLARNGPGAQRARAPPSSHPVQNSRITRPTRATRTSYRALQNAVDNLPNQGQLFKECTKGFPVDPSWARKEKLWSAAQEKRDKLLLAPTPKTSVYIDKNRKVLFDDHYKMVAQRKRAIGERHPKIVQAEKSGNLTPRLVEFYKYLSPKINIPLAGTPSEPAFANSPEEPKQDQEMFEEPEQAQEMPEQAQPVANQAGSHRVGLHDGLRSRERRGGRHA